MDWIAGRARTSKAALYRRWNSRAELVVHAHGQLVRSALSAPDTGSFAAEARAQLLEAGPHLIDEVYRRAIERGEVRPELRGTRVMTVAHDLLRNEFITRGTPIEDAAIEEILHTVYLPLVRARSE
ncbi:hypothetical protein BJF90_19695 [Pseudonocardia sp. CNS-004]|nr:hypothetical protein BJF90_19695 [Pseudonocardia sp. CNS-004]